MNHRIFCRRCVRAALFFASLFTGCGTTTETVYLNELSVNGPIVQPPLHLTDKPVAGELHALPRASVAPRREIETVTDGNVYTPDHGFPGKNNLHWSVPSTQFGIDFDYMLSDRFALSFGLTYAPTNRQESWGGNAGFGFPFAGEVVSGRMEVGVQFQSMWYDARSVVVTRHTSWGSGATTTNVSYFHDIDRSTPWNVFATLTVNSHTEHFVNFFGSVSVSRQTLATFEPTDEDVLVLDANYHYTDARAEQTTTFVFVTPGVIFTVSPSVRLIAGARLMKSIGVGESIPVLVAPSITLDFGL